MQVGWSHFVVRTGRTLSLAEAGAQPRTGLMVTKFVELVIVLQGVRLANTLIMWFWYVFGVSACLTVLQSLAWARVQGPSFPISCGTNKPPIIEVFLCRREGRNDSLEYPLYNPRFRA